MDMERAYYEHPGRQMHSFRTFFVVLMPACIYALLSEVLFCCGCFFISSSNISKTPFSEHLCTMTSISSIEKDSIATTTDSFKDCIIAGKTIIYRLDRRIVRKQLESMPTYHYVQNQGQLMMQIQENGQKPQFGQFFDDFKIKYLQIANFSEK